MSLEQLDNWFEILKDNKFLLIAGPCSAESKEQVLSTAKQIKQYTPFVQIFRAGLWKPRTTPNSFEGIGEKGIEWLKEVKEKYNFLITTEIAKPKHLEILLKNNVIDIIWLGARTVSNPFSVQEIADALKGIDIPVLIKNPVFPDLRLWIGSIERIYKAGIRKIAAIHRGFYPFEKSKLRNLPKWELLIELKTQIPSLPIIGDPSHLAGDKNYILEIAQFFINLNVNGLMIETHISPEKALSDAKQQLTPLELKQLFENLSFNQNKPDKLELNELKKFRTQIDSIDYQIIELLARRMEIVKEIGNFKKKHKLSIFDLERWNKIKSSRLKFAKDLGLNENFLKKIIQLIHKEAIDIQQKIDKNEQKN